MTTPNKTIARHDRRYNAAIGLLANQRPGTTHHYENELAKAAGITVTEVRRDIETYWHIFGRAL